MLKQRRRSLIPFQRSPMTRENVERVDSMIEQIRGHARQRDHDRHRLAREQLDALQEEQRLSRELHRITRGYDDPDLLHFARLGLIADPDEIDRDFGWFFRNATGAPDPAQEIVGREGQTALQPGHLESQGQVEPDASHSPGQASDQDYDALLAEMRGIGRGVWGLARESFDSTVEFLGALKDAVVHRATGDEAARDGRETIDQAGAELVSFFEEALDNPEDVPGRIVDDVQDRHQKFTDNLDEAASLDRKGRHEEAGEVRGRAYTTGILDFFDYASFVTGPGGIAAGSVKKVAKLPKKTAKKSGKNTVKAAPQQLDADEAAKVKELQKENKREILRNNVKVGKALEDEAVKEAIAKGYTVATQITIEFPTKDRMRVDLHVTKPDGSSFNVECKSSETACFTQRQKVGIPLMEIMQGKIVGRAKPQSEAPGGKIVDPHKMVIYRKKGDMP